MMSLLYNEHYKLAGKKVVRYSFLIMPLFICVLPFFFTKLIKGTDGNVIDFMSVLSNFLIITVFLAIGLAGSILANEYQTGTVKLLLIRPRTRSMVLFAKWLTVQLYGIYLLISTFIFSWIIGGMVYGFGSGFGLMFQKVLLAYGITFLELMLISTFTYAGSAVFKNSAFSIGLGMAALLGGKLVTEVSELLELSFGKILLFANTQWDQYLFGNTPILPGMSPGFSVIILIMHFIFFYGVAWFFFAKRDVTV
jgi:ABC-2 type transport system permease protein